MTTDNIIRARSSAEIPRDGINLFDAGLFEDLSTCKCRSSAWRYLNRSWDAKRCKEMQRQLMRHIEGSFIRMVAQNANVSCAIYPYYTHVCSMDVYAYSCLDDL